MEIYQVTALMEGWGRKGICTSFWENIFTLRFPETMAGWWWMFCSLSALCVMAHVKRVSRRNSAKKSLFIKNKSESVRGMFLIVIILFPWQTASQWGRMVHSLMQMLFPLPAWFPGWESWLSSPESSKELSPTALMRDEAALELGAASVSTGVQQSPNHSKLESFQTHVACQRFRQGFLLKPSGTNWFYPCLFCKWWRNSNVSIFSVTPDTHSKSRALAFVV